MKSTIPMKPCDSSQIATHGYDPVTKTMALQFKQKNGTTVPYHYANVSPEMYAEFEAAESKGRFFGQRLKSNAEAHPFTKMVDDGADQQESAEAA